MYGMYMMPFIHKPDVRELRTPPAFFSTLEKSQNYEQLDLSVVGPIGMSTGTIPSRTPGQISSSYERSWVDCFRENKSDVLNVSHK